MYQDETVRFLTERLEHDSEMLEQVGKSRSVFDLIALQQQWFSAATRADSNELMRLSKLTCDASQSSVGEARSDLHAAQRAAYDTE